MIISKQITNRESKSLDQYFQDIGKIDLITPEEEIQLALLIKKGDEVAKDKLIKANLRFVVSVAKQFQNQGLTLGDLINEGNIGLIKAAQKFDVTRGFKFISYAVWWIRQGIMQAIADQQRVVRLPLNRISLLTKISKASKALEQEYERKPSAEELAHYLDISTDEVSYTLQTSGRQLSFDAPLSKSNENNNSLLDIIPDNMHTLPDKDLMKESLKSEVKNILVNLSEREAKVIMLSYGIGCEKSATLEEIGDQFNLTRERIRQIKEKALSKLKQSEKSNRLRKFLG
ncbi:MAG: RNA polymerase sigma factor RpoD/SigA [Ignavibacterium sp.]|nr:MAG: RNA polymerase sigma factor RpoD/SigA [Ignavibacterium sp.]